MKKLLFLVLISAGLWSHGGAKWPLFAYACPPSFRQLAVDLPSEKGEALINLAGKISRSRRNLDPGTLDQLVALIREYPVLQAHVVAWASKIGIRNRLAEAGAEDLFKFVDSPSDVEMNPPSRRRTIIDRWDIMGLAIILTLQVVIATDFHMGQEIHAGDLPEDKEVPIQALTSDMESEFVRPPSETVKEISEDLTKPKPHEEESDSDQHEKLPRN